MSQKTQRPRVVIVGGGFGGLHTALQLRRAPVDVTLVDRRNFHLFQPLLYQVATGALSPANIAAPLRHILRRQKNCRVLLGTVTQIAPARRTICVNGIDCDYDILILAAGATHSYFGNEQWSERAPGLKTIEDATLIRARIYRAFEAAERETDPAARTSWLTFVIVGGGPTGVELAGALAEIARHSLKHDFRSIDPRDAKILLVEAGERVLMAFPEELSRKAEQTLTQLGVDVRDRTRVSNVEQQSVTLQSGESTETVPAKTVLWAAGVQASPLARMLAEATSVPLDRAGRVVVDSRLRVAGLPEVFVIGDMAHVEENGHQLPGIAPVAIQQGKYVGRTILAELSGRTVQPFHYHDPGSLATIGRSAAVADFGKLKLSGFTAWVIWLFVHLMNIVSFRNRLLVLMQWGWNYLTYDRSARLITGESHPPDEET